MLDSSRSVNCEPNYIAHGRVRAISMIAHSHRPLAPATSQALPPSTWSRSDQLHAAAYPPSFARSTPSLDTSPNHHPLHTHTDTNIYRDPIILQSSINAPNTAGQAYHTFRHLHEIPGAPTPPLSGTTFLTVLESPPKRHIRISMARKKQKPPPTLLKGRKLHRHDLQYGGNPHRWRQETAD